jgi:hypothetical protein
MITNFEETRLNITKKETLLTDSIYILADMEVHGRWTFSSMFHVFLRMA